jgi:hypothetical protein
MSKHDELFPVLQIGVNPSSSARIRRDAAARAMQGWHAHRLLANDMYGDHILKVKISCLLFACTFNFPTIWPFSCKYIHIFTGQRFNRLFKSR